MAVLFRRPEVLEIAFGTYTHFGTGHGDAAITVTRVLFTVSPASVLIFCHLCLQLGLGVVVYSLLSLLFVPNSNESASSAPGDIK